MHRGLSCQPCTGRGHCRGPLLKLGARTPRVRIGRPSARLLTRVRVQGLEVFFSLTFLCGLQFSALHVNLFFYCREKSKRYF